MQDASALSTILQHINSPTQALSYIG